jgi:hypothetical protein
LPIATTTAGAASGYLWTTPFGTVGSTGTIDSGDVNSRIITVSYSSNAAASVGDSIKLRFTSACGNGSFKAQKLSNLAKSCFSSGNPIYTKQQSGKMEISPNPSDGNFRLKISNNNTGLADIKITIIDQLGNVVFTEMSKSNFGQYDQRINLSQRIRPGVYWVRFETANESESKRIIIQ